MKIFREVFCLTEFEDILLSLSAEDMETLLEDIDVSVGEKDAEQVKRLSFKKTGLKPLGERKIVFLRAAALAACFCAVVIGAFVAANNFQKPQPQPESSTSSTASSSGEKALMLAISNGDEGLIETLLKSGVLASRDILDYAIDCTSFLSYDVISEIAQSVEEVFGSTGLDPLLESTLIGNSQKALQELENRENILMTPTEKLAFFFAVAFCDSDVVESFCEKGADISATDAAGNNIFQIAQKYGNDDNLSFAAEHGVK